MSPAHMLLAVPLLLAQFGPTPNEVVSKAGRVGVDVERRENVLVVTKVEPGSSAETVGLKVGDQILRIDLDNAERYSESDAVAALRGVLGSRATLTVLPRAAMLPKRIDVLRDVRVYLANENVKPDVTAPGAPGGSGAAEAAETAEREPVVAMFMEASGARHDPPAAVLDALGPSGPDVATCVNALRDLLPAGFPEEFAADFTVTHGTISVRTEPASGDLASCLGRQAAHWQLPRPGAKDPPIEFRAVWKWGERTMPPPAPTATASPSP